MEQTIEIAKRDFCGLCFVNLVDFDALWGHRRNPIGYGQEIERFDVKLGQLLPVLREDDLLIITATTEMIRPIPGRIIPEKRCRFLRIPRNTKGSGPLPEEDTFAVIGATIADNFSLAMPEHTIGHSILDSLR